MMLKAFKSKELRLPYRSRGRAAFSLAELVVAVGILALMMALAGQVFSLTSKSTRQANALTELSQRFRTFEKTLREDLRYAGKGNSIMVIQANPINAYWTRAGREADDDVLPQNGYPHPEDPEREGMIGEGLLNPPRADVLMFFTARRASSAIYPGVTSQVQQVVYGHAIQGEYVVSGDSEEYEFQPSVPDDVAPFPAWPASAPTVAEDWHLARRSLLLMPPTVQPANMFWAMSLYDDGNGGTEPQYNIFEGATDVVENFIYEDRVLKPHPEATWPFWFPPVIQDVFGQLTIPGAPMPFGRSELDLTPPALYANRMAPYFLPKCASFKVEWAFDPQAEWVGGRLDGEREIYWIDPGNLGDLSSSLDNPEDDDPLASLDRAWRQAQGPRKARLGELLDPQVRLLGRDYSSIGGPAGRNYSLSEAYRPAGLGGNPEYEIPGYGRRLVVFTANRVGWTPDPDDPQPLEPVEIFPAALRITVDLYDDEGRLDRPLRYVMVIPVGLE
jgi:type II secretory pathway pseudopilin PulG